MRGFRPAARACLAGMDQAKGVLLALMVPASDPIAALRAVRAACYSCAPVAPALTRLQRRLIPAAKASAAGTSTPSKAGTDFVPTFDIGSLKAHSNRQKAPSGCPAACSSPSCRPSRQVCHSEMTKAAASYFQIQRRRPGFLACKLGKPPAKAPRRTSSEHNRRIHIHNRHC